MPIRPPPSSTRKVLESPVPSEYQHAATIAHGHVKVTSDPLAVIMQSNVALMHRTMAIFNAWCDLLPMLAPDATGPVDADRGRSCIDWIRALARTTPRGPTYVNFDAALQERRLDEIPDLPDPARYGPPLAPEPPREAVRLGAKMLAEALGAQTLTSTSSSRRRSRPTTRSKSASPRTSSTRRRLPRSARPT